MRTLIISAGLSFLLLCPAGAKHLAVAKHLAHAKPVDSQAINNAEWDPSLASKKVISAPAIKAEILLARAYFSPGEISGRPGENLTKAIAAFAEAQGKATSTLDRELWDKLVSMSADPVIVDYTISEADVRGPFLEKIPGKMERMKDLPHLFYTSPRRARREISHEPGIAIGAQSGREI